MVLQNIWRGVVGNVLIDISPSNIFLTNCFSLQNVIKIVRLLLAAVSINGLIHLQGFFYGKSS